jgi:hypothetical protein
MSQSSRVSTVAAVLAFALLPAAVTAQSTPGQERFWSFSAETDYFLREDVDFLMPVFSADGGPLHFEGRWNYEDLETLSVWAGWSFEAGRKLQLSVTPMVGGLVGRTKGFAPGLELALSWRRLELSSQSEHVFDVEGHEGDFFYNWSELTFQALPWLSVGLAAQRTRLYQSDREIDRGIVVSLMRRGVSLSIYSFDPDVEERFVIVALAVDF